MFDPKQRFKLFKQHKHFCAAPWNHLYVHMDGSIKTCTKGLSMGDANVMPIEDILNNTKYRVLRNDILNDKITDNCKYCLGFENSVAAGDFQSLRNHYNKNSMHTSLDHMDVQQHKLTTVDLHWSSVCDLKCVTCWAGQSSSIAKEQGIPVVTTTNQTAKRITEYIVNNQSELKELYLSGGEPTLIKYNLKLLQQLEKRKDLCIRVNTNMQWKNDNAIIQEIIKFPNVMITCSADGLGNKFNYIRRGGNWDLFSANLKYLQSFEHIDIRVNTVFFVLTAQDMSDIIDYFMEKQNTVDHTINQISMGQEHLRARNLPTEVKNKTINKLEHSLKKYQHNLNISGCIKNCLAELDNPAVDDYKHHFDKIDLVQGSNWRQLYPELT